MKTSTCSLQGIVFKLQVLTYSICKTNAVLILAHDRFIIEFTLKLTGSEQEKLSNNTFAHHSPLDFLSTLSGRVLSFFQTLPFFIRFLDLGAWITSGGHIRTVMKNLTLLFLVLTCHTQYHFYTCQLRY